MSATATMELLIKKVISPSYVARVMSCFEESRPGCMTQGMMRQRAALGRGEAVQSSRLDHLMPIG